MPNFQQGPILGTVANQTHEGMGLISWANPDSILLDDGSSFATVNLTHGSPQSELINSQGFPFTVPSIATILGIQLSYKAYYSLTDGNGSLSLFVYQGGVTAASGGFSHPAPDVATFTIGGPSELFGLTWTPTNVNDGGLGLGMVAGLSGLNPAQFGVAAHYATVYYQANATDPSNGGVTAFERIALYPMSNGNIYAFDPLSGFDDSTDAGNYFWRVEEISVGRKPTIDRIFVTYRDLGPVTLRFTLTATQDDQTVISNFVDVKLGNTSPTGFLLTKQIFIPVTSGMNMQLSMSRAAGAGPIAIAKVKVCGRVETESNA